MVPCHACGKKTSTALDRAHFVKPEHPDDDEALLPDGTVKVYYCPECQKEWEKKTPDAVRTVAVIVLSLLGAFLAIWLWGVWYAGPPMFFALAFVLFYAFEKLAAKWEARRR